MLYQFASQMLLRSPVKNPAAYSADPQIFLNDSYFLAAIRLATPVFYHILERQNFAAAGLSGKEATTLQKYINRYCFRPTPFGLFSSVSLIGQREAREEISLNSRSGFYISTAMPLQNRLNSDLAGQIEPSQALFESNPSIYRVLGEYRFFRSGLNETGTRREYQLQSIAFSKVLKDLLLQCNIGISIKDIVHQIIRLTECNKEEAEDYAGFLIDAQLLLSRNRMTITGPDHLTQLAAKMQSGTGKDQLLIALSRQSQKITGAAPALINRLEHDLDILMAGQEAGRDKLNVILKEEPSVYVPGPDLRDKLRDGVAALGFLSTGGPPVAMHNFIKSFQRHFEGQTLPLLQALDPEAGIGYQDTETEINNPLLETLNIPYQSSSNNNRPWHPAHSLLMESWLRDRSIDPVIRLHPADLTLLKSKGTADQVLGMSIIFRLAGNQVLIENAGGVNAPALMGRFTVADENIAAAARMMAGQLEQSNPDLIFAELLHLTDPHTDNVNRRVSIYQYEIPVTAASQLPDKQQIRLSDLYIKIVDNKAILFSKAHQKLVIPFHTSAYNHSLNKLPLFRFLADLPYQYGRTNLGFDLRHYFPGLHFYPRVEYKETILGLATWVVNERQISELTAGGDGSVEAFFKFSTAVRLPRYFSLAEGDQELVYDGQSARDINFFINCIQQKKELILKEFLEQPEVKQFNAYLLPVEPLQLPDPGDLKLTHLKTQRKYIPGSSWLYLKLYAPKIGVNRLLLRLAPLFSKIYNGYKIRQWFFIRYEDHAPHIRLRLEVDPGSINELLLAFKTKIEDRIQQHVIREFQIDVYNRELERYAAGGIENTERFFWASSELVLHFLKHFRKNPHVSTYAFALYAISVMVREFIIDPEEQLQFILSSYQQFLPEFTDKPFKIALDKKYRELTPGIRSSFQIAEADMLSGSIKGAQNLRQSLQVIRKQMAGITDNDYLRSIIHMHLNRIFTDESRKQEMICYYLLHKHLLSVKGRLRKSG
jgi:thiopeptide-type bacteriocin biosynthesis protein